MKETKKALKELGYNVIPFFLTDEVWDNARDLVASMTANGIFPGILEDIENEAETLQDNLKPMHELLNGNKHARSMYEVFKMNMFSKAR